MHEEDINKTKDMSFLIIEEKLPEKYNDIWMKSAIVWKKNLIMRLYTMKKILSRNGQHKFYGDKVPKEGSQCICLSVILIDSVFIADENYYPQLCLEKCKHIF